MHKAARVICYCAIFRDHFGILLLKIGSMAAEGKEIFAVVFLNIFHRIYEFVFIFCFFSLVLNVRIAPILNVVYKEVKKSKQITS